MNSILIIALIAAFATVNVFAGLLPEQAFEYVTVCRSQLDINDSEFNQLVAAQTYDEVNTKSKCFFNCFQEREGTLVDGVLQEDKVLELFEGSVGEKKAKEIYNICSKAKGSDNCETAFKLQICYRENGIF